jgi:hypothetical protein
MKYGGLYGETKKVYEIPRHFKLSELQQKQREEALAKL